jgi:hypothetical protein
MVSEISDATVVDVLRRIDRLMSPPAQRLGRSPTRPQAERDRWWAEAVPRFAAVVAAAPRFVGRLADLLPLQNTVGAAVQSFVVLGVASEHGAQAPADRVSLLARVLLDRKLAPEGVEPLLRHAPGTYREEAFGPPGRGVVGTLWRTSRLLGRIDDALGARPKGKLRHRLLGNLPVIGVVGGYAAEREGLRRAATTAAAALTEVSGSASSRRGWRRPPASRSTGSW